MRAATAEECATDLITRVGDKLKLASRSRRRKDLAAAYQQATDAVVLLNQTLLAPEGTMQPLYPTTRAILYRLRALARMFLGQTADAFEDFEMAEATHPWSMNRLAYGIALHRAGRTKDGERWITKVNPKNETPKIRETILRYTMMIRTGSVDHVHGKRFVGPNVPDVYLALRPLAVELAEVSVQQSRKNFYATVVANIDIAIAAKANRS